MSAVFKNAKKKAQQQELRKMLQEHKIKTKMEVKKIDSPLAKYDDRGQLTCTLCQTIVRSDAVWSIHVNAKQHKQNIEMAKKLKERTHNFTVPLKRPLTPPSEVPSKVPKGILKNSLAKEEDKPSEPSTSGIPSDFFDSGASDLAKRLKIGSNAEKESENKEGEVLPEGFFDDPKLDAKARNVDYKDPIEEEWERFQKEMRDAEGESAAIIAEDQEESTTERQIDEIEEQMKQLSK